MHVGMLAGDAKRMYRRHIKPLPLSLGTQNVWVKNWGTDRERPTEEKSRSVEQGIAPRSGF